MIFFWAQEGRRGIFTKFVLHLSGYSQYSRWSTGTILRSWEWFISTWYFSWNAISSVLVSCAWLISTSVWTGFPNIAFITTICLCGSVFATLAHRFNKCRKTSDIELTQFALKLGRFRKFGNINHITKIIFATFVLQGPLNGICGFHERGNEQ